MNQDGGFQPSPIKVLPVELLQMILGHLTDVPSLHTAVLSCSLFYRVFLTAEMTITRQVLFNQISVNVLPEAMIASESALLREYSDSETRVVISNFVAQNLRQRPTPTRSWSLPKALRLGRLHFYVEAWAEKFVEVTLTKKPLKRSQRPVTYQEICRIQRALYRFEIYCNLFREVLDVNSPVYNEQESLYFARFASYENEQLGCIHDFLVRAITPGNFQVRWMLLRSITYEKMLAFNDVAEHDVSWGAWNVDYIFGLDSPWAQYILSLGLQKLCEISSAETYEERYRALDATKCPSVTLSFLHEGFEIASERNNDVFLEDLTPENETLHIKSPFFKDPDPGPLDAWRWAHLEETRSNWVYQEDRKELREWGYVIWDRVRLEAVGIFDGSWRDMVSARDLTLERQNIGREQAYMQNSWEKREEIRRAGGSGWWSWGDESKVKWKGGVAPWEKPSIPRIAKPDSLQEARELLSMMKLPPSTRK
ncbi:hypothetical protein CHU98_g10120 [Xylaria longipes]|nr:hypothetical protein CHU98_g10120 [Xylaria longipes]